MLEERREGSIIVYYCKECNKELGWKEIYTGSGSYLSDCRHYYWEIVTKTCFYDYEQYGEKCDPENVKNLKKKYLVKISRTDDVYLLLPHGGDTNED